MEGGEKDGMLLSHNLQARSRGVGVPDLRVLHPAYEKEGIEIRDRKSLLSKKKAGHTLVPGEGEKDYTSYLKQDEEDGTRRYRAWKKNFKDPSFLGRFWRMYCGAYAGEVHAYISSRISVLQKQVLNYEENGLGEGRLRRAAQAELELLDSGLQVRNIFRILMYLELDMDASAFGGVFWKEAKDRIDAAPTAEKERQAQIEKGKLIQQYEMPELFKKIDLEIDEFCKWGWETSDMRAPLWGGPVPYRQPATFWERYGSQYQMFLIMIESEMKLLRGSSHDDDWTPDLGEKHYQAYLRWRNRSELDKDPERLKAPHDGESRGLGETLGDRRYATWLITSGGGAIRHAFNEIDVEMTKKLLSTDGDFAARTFEKTFYDQDGWHNPYFLLPPAYSITRIP
jgi:hypothetical protein